jgi:hypothetical protein
MLLLFRNLIHKLLKIVFRCHITRSDPSFAHSSAHVPNPQSAIHLRDDLSLILGRM